MALTAWVIWLMHKVLSVLQSLVVCASLLFRFCRYGSKLVSTFLYKVVRFYIINMSDFVKT